MTATSSSPQQPRVHVITLGGTIAMTGTTPSGVSPSLEAGQLLGAIPQLRDLATVTYESLGTVPSAALRVEDVARIVAQAGAAIESGSRGVVVVQGTDTLEETSFLADLLLDDPAPVVFTGAMRHPQQLGADGAANILDSVRVALADEARGSGALLCMNGELHAARYVQKRHSFSTAAFLSPAMGPIGWVVEGRVRVHARLGEGERFPLHGLATPLPRIALLRLSLGDDGILLDGLEERGFDGLVIEAFGAGHVPPWIVEPLSLLSDAMPVVLASRTGGGEGLRQTYGFDGSESDLLHRGLISAGALDGLKARLLLTVCVGSQRTAVEIARSFERWSR